MSCPPANSCLLSFVSSHLISSPLTFSPLLIVCVYKSTTNSRCILLPCSASISLLALLILDSLYGYTHTTVLNLSSVCRPPSFQLPASDSDSDSTTTTTRMIALSLSTVSISLHLISSLLPSSFHLHFHWSLVARDRQSLYCIFACWPLARSVQSHSISSMVAPDRYPLERRTGAVTYGSRPAGGTLISLRKILHVLLGFTLLDPSCMLECAVFGVVFADSNVRNNLDWSIGELIGST